MTLALGPRHPTLLSRLVPRVCSSRGAGVPVADALSGKGAAFVKGQQAREEGFLPQMTHYPGGRGSRGSSRDAKQGLEAKNRNVLGSVWEGRGILVDPEASSEPAAADAVFA